MNNSEAVYKACRVLYSSNHVYRVAELPFFVFAEPNDDHTANSIATVLLDHLDQAVAHLSDDALVQNIKGGVIGFETSSMLKPDVADYPLAHHQVIGQEALNVGMKHLLREGRTTDEFVAEVNSITADEVRAVVRKHLVRDKMIQVAFGPRT
jgi:hypothetical protein